MVRALASSSSNEFSLTKYETSAICTPISYKPSSIYFIETASSKSLAVAGSIVHIISLVKSNLFCLSSFEIMNSLLASN